MQGDDDDDVKTGATRQGGGGSPVPADDPLDRSVEEKDASEAAERATPPTEGPAAAGSLPG